MPVDVQKNTSFTPAIYMTEVTATGNYSIDYTIELNSSLPFVIESSAEIKKENDYTYTAQNVNGDFYFVFSSSKKPTSIYGDNTKIEPWRIALFVIAGIAGCVLVVLVTILIIHYVKEKRIRKGSK